MERSVLKYFWFKNNFDIKEVTTDFPTRILLFFNQNLKFKPIFLTIYEHNYHETWQKHRLESSFKENSIYCAIFNVNSGI